MIHFTVSGIPKAQPRPRAFARKMGDKFVARVFDDGTAEAWKSCIALAAKPHRPESPHLGPVRVEIEYWIPRLKSHFNSKGEIKASAPLHHISKPDKDNLDKAVFDALTQVGGFWRDDSQVAESWSRKVYNLAPGCSIKITAIANP